MTKPSITYGHGFLHDCNTLVTDGGSEGKWTETDANSIATWAVDNDDYFKVTVTPTADAQTANLSYHLATNLAGSVYKKMLVRWKTPTATASPGVKGGLITTYLTGDPVTTDLGYNSLFKVNTITLDPARTIDKLAFKVTSDGASSGTFYVWFDFILIVKDIFSFANTAFGREWIPPTRNVFLEPPGRITDIYQNLGVKSAKWRCSCDLDLGIWIRTGDTVLAQVFDDIQYNSATEPFQWLDTDMGRQFKAVLDEEPIIRYESDRRVLDLVFREYSRCSKSSESPEERFGLNL